MKIPFHKPVVPNSLDEIFLDSIRGGWLTTGAVTLSFENILKEYLQETKSKIAENILTNFDEELNKFIQVCPIEMLDKLDNPISLKQIKSKSA